MVLLPAAETTTLTLTLRLPLMIRAQPPPDRRPSPVAVVNSGLCRDNCEAGPGAIHEADQPNSALAF
jgi:hypothetical protein